MRRAKGKVKGPRMIHEIHRLSKLGISQRQIANALDVSRNTVKKYLEGANLPSATGKNYSAPWSGQLDWQVIQLETEKGECLYYLWEERFGENSDNPTVPYVSFWREFKRRYPNIPIDFHKDHPPGERCEVDFKGETTGLGYTDQVTGKFVSCRMFGAILCFSQLLFIRVTEDEKQPSFLSSVARSYEYFGGVPHTTAVDNAKAQVSRAHRYDADINPEFFKFANHYGTAPLAMRPKKPKDKNLIENALGVFWRWCRRKIKKKNFRSIGEINGFILEQLAIFNDRIQRKYGTSRRQKFTSYEKEHLLKLPETNYSTGAWKKAKVHPDCHVQVEYNFYSVPHKYVREQVDVRISVNSIEVFVALERVAIHPKFGSNTRGRYKTDKSHLPLAHQAISEQVPQNIIDQAEKIGPATLEVIESLLVSPKHHPFTYLRRALGIVRLAKRHSAVGLEDACTTVLGLRLERPRLRDIEGIIKFNQSQKPRKAITRQPNVNLRGQDSWRDKLN